MAPLLQVACSRRESCVELILAVPGIDVNCVDNHGAGVLEYAASHIMDSLGRVGLGDTTRIF